MNIQVHLKSATYVFPIPETGLGNRIAFRHPSCRIPVMTIHNRYSWQHIIGDVSIPTIEKLNWQYGVHTETFVSYFDAAELVVRDESYADLSVKLSRPELITVSDTDGAVGHDILKCPVGEFGEVRYEQAKNGYKMDVYGEGCRLSLNVSDGPRGQFSSAIFYVTTHGLYRRIAHNKGFLGPQSDD